MGCSGGGGEGAVVPSVLSPNANCLESGGCVTVVDLGMWYAALLGDYVGNVLAASA